MIPFFAVIGCGYAGARLVGEDGQRGINNLVLYFALPALLFSTMARSDLAARFEGDFVTAYTVVSVLLFAVAFLVVRVTFSLGRSEAAIQAMGSVYGNTGYMGLSIVVVMLGQPASVPVVLSLVIDLAVMVPLTAAIVESGDPRSGRGVVHGAAAALRANLRNPLIVAAAAGAAWSLLELPMPGMLDGFLDLLGAAAAPCALFAMGSSLYGRAPGRNGGAGPRDQRIQARRPSAAAVPCHDPSLAHRSRLDPPGADRRLPARGGDGLRGRAPVPHRSPVDVDHNPGVNVPVVADGAAGAARHRTAAGTVTRERRVVGAPVDPPTARPRHRGRAAGLNNTLRGFPCRTRNRSRAAAHRRRSAARVRRAG
ncbi:MAG: AEC family transporter [Gammaproteobacteria bacterium]|nr:AEC family transporter [Gammaproteobacteria bacterium]